MSQTPVTTEPIENPADASVATERKFASVRTAAQVQSESPSVGEQPGRAANGSAAKLVKDCVWSFIEDDALSRGASIAFYVVTSLVPVMVIVVSIAGAVFGRDAAQGALAAQLSGVMGQQSAEFLQTAVHGASGKSAGIIATVLGLITLLLTSSGVFGEMQAALNVIWKEAPKRGIIARVLRGRMASLVLVGALGFMLLASLAIEAILAVPGAYIDAHFVFGKPLLSILNLAISFVLEAGLFAAIYKILPDTDLEWHDVFVGAIATAFLFGVGKLLIGLYLRSSAIASTYGAAGGLIALLLWIYYSAQVFLLGAEFTKAYASRKGSQQDRTDLIPPKV
jgi:membrane protein